LVFVKHILTQYLAKYENALRVSVLDENDRLSRHYTQIVLEIKRAIEILADSGEY